MNILIVTIAILICVIALVGTISVGKVVNNTIKNQDQAQENKTQQESSVKNVPVLVGIYAITFVVIIIIFLVFMFM